MTAQLAFLLKNIPNLLIGFPNHRPGGLLLSLILALFAIGLGMVIAVFVGIGYEAKMPAFRRLSHLYVTIFRGLPLLLLLLFVHSLIGGRWRGIEITATGSALVALTLYSSAYQAEIVRAGLRAVPARWVEAARLLGSRPWQVLLLVKLRYVWQVMLPAFTGEAISLFKDTSVVLIIGVADLMTVARIALGSDVGNAPFWMGMSLLVGFFYFVVAFTLSQWAQRWERRLQKGDLVYSLVNY